MNDGLIEFVKPSGAVVRVAPSSEQAALSLGWKKPETKPKTKTKPDMKQRAKS